MGESQRLRHLTNAHGRRAQELALSAALLGDEHRLVRTLDLLAVLRRQLLLSSLALAAGAIWFAVGVSRAAAVLAAAVLAAAGLVELVLVGAILTSRAVRRDLARELIIGGRDDLPLHVLVRERHRLTNPRTQAGLARALERLIQTAATWPRTFPTARPVFDVRQVRAATPQLKTVAELLNTEPAQARAVALIERLLTCGGSPLYGQQPDELRRELELIRAALERDRGAWCGGGRPVRQ
jgi:hypothetical protein